MWILNLDKSVQLNLNKNTFFPWEIVKWNVSFDFWLEKIKVDKIFIIFRKIRKVEKEVMTQNGISYHTEYRTFTIFNKTLKWKWEYNIENINFDFQIPKNILPRTWIFDKKLSQFLEKLKIKWTLKNIIELAISFFMRTDYWIPTFEVEARLDIPWAKDIYDIRTIEIREQNENKTEKIS
jgi:hypothetical protein